MELTYERTENTSVLYGSENGDKDLHVPIPKGRSKLECKTVKSSPKVTPTYLITLTPHISSLGPSSCPRPKPQLLPAQEPYPQLLLPQRPINPTAALLVLVKLAQSPFRPLIPFVAPSSCRSPSPYSSRGCTLPPNLKSPGHSVASGRNVHLLPALKLQPSPLCPPLATLPGLSVLGPALFPTRVLLHNTTKTKTTQTQN